MMVLSFALAFVGFVALSFAMKRHFSQMLPRGKKLSSQQVVVFSVVGYLSLLLAGVLCIMVQGVAVGLVLWMGVLTAAALLQSLLLTYRPKKVIVIGLATLAVGIITGIAG